MLGNVRCRKVYTNGVLDPRIVFRRSFRELIFWEYKQNVSALVLNLYRSDEILIISVNEEYNIFLSLPQYSDIGDDFKVLFRMPVSDWRL